MPKNCCYKQERLEYVNCSKVFPSAARSHKLPSTTNILEVNGQAQRSSSSSTTCTACDCQLQFALTRPERCSLMMTACGENLQLMVVFGKQSDSFRTEESSLRMKKTDEGG